MYISRDSSRSSGSLMAVEWWYAATKELSVHLSAIFKAAFPEEYIQYKSAFDAGNWFTDDPGPWLGRAIIWKMQVRSHRDGLDGGPSIIFNMGRYTGGHLYLTDLKLKFRFAIYFINITLYFTKI